MLRISNRTSSPQKITIGGMHNTQPGSSPKARKRSSRIYDVAGMCTHEDVESASSSIARSEENWRRSSAKWPPSKNQSPAPWLPWALKLWYQEHRPFGFPLFPLFLSNPHRKVPHSAHANYHLPGVVDTKGISRQSLCKNPLLCDDAKCRKTKYS
jgi:hypothetical protein